MKKRNGNFPVGYKYCKIFRMVNIAGETGTGTARALSMFGANISLPYTPQIMGLGVRNIRLGGYQ